MGLGLLVGNMVVDGVVVGNGLGLADLGLGLPISTWAGYARRSRSRPHLRERERVIEWDRPLVKVGESLRL
uniref:Uncharacterized protein n=1 Tax=Fagus sylvatica TaxID=28930 RepID=A0A2N9HWM7_FAGSY